MTEDYRYIELEDGHIRVLHIYPHLYDGLLQGRLQNIALKDAKDSFVALSWTWGTESGAENNQHISLDGHLLSIRPNLWNMLNAFRNHNESLSFWVDAICIDQNKANPQEKNKQIPMMADIYRAAKEVYVWLGPSEDDSDYVMDSLRSNSDEVFTSARFVTGFVRIVHRSWWTRTWVVQEYILNSQSPNIFCGEGPGVSGDLMLKIWKRIITQNLISQVSHTSINLQRLIAVSRLHYLRDSRYNPNGVHLERNLRNALLWLKNFEVTEPRDKIYGCLGLIDARHREQFVTKVGMHTNEAVAKVYLDATVYLLECEKTSTIFYDFHIGRDNGLDAPSWVPNFNLDVTSASKTAVRLGDVSSDHLDIPREDISLSSDHTIMFARGQILDCVTKTIIVGDQSTTGGDGRNISLDVLQMPHLLHKIQDLVHQSIALPFFKQQPIEPLWKTLIAGTYGSSKDEELNDEDGCQKRFDELMSIPLDRSSDSEVLQNFNQSPHILAKIWCTLTVGRTFFTGAKGCYGLSEAGTQVGDMIVLLFPDHFIPFIFRERDDAYEMVGVAYLPQPVRDTAIAEIQRDRTRLRSFTIV